MINPISSVPCPIRLSTHIVPSAQNVPMNGEVAKALLVSGLEDAPKVTAPLAGGWTIGGDPHIFLPAGTNVTEIRPGSVIVGDKLPFAQGATVTAVRHGYSSGSCSVASGSPMVCLSPLAMDSNPKVGARMFGKNIPANTIVAATSEQPQAITLEISNSFGDLLVPKTSGGLYPGMMVEGTNVPPGTVIEGVTAPVVQLDAQAAASHTGEAVVFAKLPATLELKAASVSAGDTVISVPEANHITVGMIVTALGIPKDTVVMGADTVANTLTLSAPVTADATNLSLVLTAPKSAIAGRISAAEGVRAYTELVPQSLDGIAPGMYVERADVPLGTQVRELRSGKVVANGALGEVSALTTTVFRETQSVIAKASFLASKDIITLALAQSAIVPGMMVEAAGVPAGTIITKVDKTTVTINSLTTAASAVNAQAVFVRPAVSAAGTFTCPKGTARTTVLDVTPTAPADVTRLRKDMVLRWRQVWMRPLWVWMRSLQILAQR